MMHNYREADDFQTEDKREKPKLKWKVAVSLCGALVTLIASCQAAKLVPAFKRERLPKCLAT